AEVLWKTGVGTGFSSMSVVNGRVYTMGNIKDTDIVYCLDAKTGKEIWKYSYPSPLDAKNYEGGPNATPTIDGNRVYTLSKLGMAFCLNVENGSVIWSKDFNKDFGIKSPNWGLAGSPLIVDDLVIFNAGTTGIALNKMDGSLKWQNGSDESGYATPLPFTLDGKKYLALFTAKSLAGLLAATGEVKWEFPWKTSYNVNAADPIVTGDKIFISSGYNRGSALLKVTPDSVTQIWQNEKNAMRNQCNSSILINGYAYGFDGQVGGKGKLTCLELETGQVKWAQDGMGTGSLTAADGKLIILSEKGMLVMAEALPDAYKEISSLQILSGKCWTTPVIAEGRIYARNAAGDLVCVDVKSGSDAKASSAKNSWPQFRGPSRDGKSAETGLLKKWPEGGPKMLWSVENKLGTGYSSLAIVDGLIYTVGMIENQGILFAFDLDGNLKWEKNYGPEWTGSKKGTRTTPTIDGDRLYLISGNAKVVCFDKNTGQQIWAVDGKEKFGSKDTKWGISENALIVDDKVIFTPGGEKASMVALNKNDGQTVWMTSDFSDCSSYSSPILIERGGKKIIVTQTDGYVLAVDAENGKLIFKETFADIFGAHKNINPPIPVSYKDCVYIVSGYDDGGVMYNISDDGTVFTRKWVDKTLDNHHGGVIALDGYLYGSNWLSNSKGNWVCIDWETGKVMYETAWQNKGPILYADGMFYCYDEKDGVLGLVRATPEKFDVVSS
ncbi:MAG: hypothetical protein E4H40_08215, partial [Candidatus Brocadiia bacterium]